MRLPAAVFALVFVFAFNGRAFAECGCECINNSMKPFCDDPAAKLPNCPRATCKPADAEGNDLPASAISSETRYVCKVRMVKTPEGSFRHTLICI